MLSGDRVEPGQTPTGAEEWQAPAQVRPASKILSEMFATATSQGDRMNSADTTRMADAFVEGIVELFARALYDHADQIYDNQSGTYAERNSSEAAERVETFGAVASALESLLPPDKVYDGRRDG